MKNYNYALRTGGLYAGVDRRPDYVANSRFSASQYRDLFVT